MVRNEEPPRLSGRALGQFMCETMTPREAALKVDRAIIAQHGGKSVEGDLPQHQNRSRLERPPFAGEIRPTPLDLRGLGLVVGRRASNRGCYVAILEGQAIVAPHRCPLAGKAGPVQGREEEVSRRVARKHAARSIPAIRRRSQANHKEPSLGIAESRDGFRPIGLVSIASDFDRRGVFAPGAQSWAARAGDDLRADPWKRVPGHALNVPVFTRRVRPRVV